MGGMEDQWEKVAGSMAVAVAEGVLRSEEFVAKSKVAGDLSVASDSQLGSCCQVSATSSSFYTHPVLLSHSEDSALIPMSRRLLRILSIVLGIAFVLYCSSCVEQ